MESTKLKNSKTNIDAVLANAKNQVSGTKASINDYKDIPGFTQYEVNSAGVVRRKITKAVQQIPSGKKKYLLFNDKGERRSIGPEDIKGLVPFKKPETTKAKTEKGDKEKGPSKKEKIVELHNQGKSLKEIVDATGFKYNSVYIMLRGHITLSLWDKLQKKHTKAEAIKIIHDKTGYTKDYIEWRINN
jgi:hypothetical protein